MFPRRNTAVNVFHFNKMTDDNLAIQGSQLQLQDATSFVPMCPACVCAPAPDCVCKQTECPPLTVNPVKNHAFDANDWSFVILSVLIFGIVILNGIREPFKKQ